MADGAIETPASHRGQRGFACEPCCRRKVRCDRSTPCANCRRRNETCTYAVNEQEYSQRHARHQELKRQREVRDIKRAAVLAAAQPTGPTSRSSASSAEELKSDPSRILFGSAHDLHESIDFSEHHPTPHQIKRLCSIYCENVHPIITIWPAWKIRQVCDIPLSDARDVSPGVHGFAFALYSFSVLTLSEDQCSTLLGVSRNDALSRFQGLTERALVAARFLETTDVFIVHVLFMYMHVLSYRVDMGVIWALVGMLVRIAQRQDLHRDPLPMGFNAWETEYRRRLWWQMQKLNTRAAELFGRDGAACDFTWDTKLPYGYNDSIFVPEMPFIGPAEVIPDDVMVSMIRFEIHHFEHEYHKANGRSPYVWLRDTQSPLKEKEQVIDDLERHFQSTYLRYSDPLKPGHFFAGIVGRGGPAMMRLLACHAHIKGHGGPYNLQFEQQRLAKLARKNLEYHVLTATSTSLHRFKWHASWQFQWFCFFVLILDLKAQTDLDEMESGWKLISDIFEMYPFMSFEVQKPIHAAAGDVLLQAWDSSHPRDSIEPEFMRKMRAERQKYAGPSNPSTGAQSTTQNARNAMTNGSGTNDGLGNEHLAQTATPFVSSALQGGLWAAETPHVGNLWDSLPFEEFELYDLDFLNDPAFAVS